MSILGFILQCAAVAAILGTAVGVAVRACLFLLHPLHGRLGPGPRGDLFVVAGILPAMAAMASVMATAAPSVASALGFGPDHCAGHSHHFHICFIHSSRITPALATVGAFALAAWLYRVGGLAADLFQSAGWARRLERLGARRAGPFPLVVIPGTRLCHAMGLVRRRILLSAELTEKLSAGELAGAVAHEEAHLRRRDPLATFLMAIAGTFVPPLLGAALRRLHRQASEEACDAAAAAAVGDGSLVASALIKVAGLQRAAAVPVEARAFGAHDLEDRVRALIEGVRRGSTRSHWRLGAFVAACGFALVASLHAASVHHGIETVLSRLF